MEEPNEGENDVGNDDDLLLQFLPSEIWKHVTTKLPKIHANTSMENLSNSSLFYRKLLNGENTIFLFGKVIDILVNDKNLLNINHLLNCRLVCKTWNQQIDKLITKGNYKLRLHENTILDRKLYEFDSYRNVSKFLAHFEHSHSKSILNERSPFIDGKVTLRVNDEYVFRGPNILEINQLKINGISTFFKRYGSHIKKISIILNLNSYEMFKSVLVKLREWLVELKNLTKLSITNQTSFVEDVFGQQIVYQPFPKLDKLKELHMNAWFPENVALNLIKNNNQITKLHVEKNWGSRINHEFKISGFLSLQSLTYLDINMGSIGKLENLRNFDIPKLSTLTLIADRGFNINERPKWSEVYSIIENKFANTLERLSVEMESDDSQVLEDTRSFQLNLPKLKEIRLLVKGQPVSLDFFLPMKDTLERICIMEFKAGYVPLQGEIVNLLNFQTCRAKIQTMLEILHFDKSFEDIKTIVNHRYMAHGGNGIKISDKIILQ